MNIRRSNLMLLFAAVAVALSIPGRASASAIFIGLDDNGHEFTLDRGDAIVISLPATSGTGYTWQAEPVTGGLVKQIGDTAFERDSAMPGASGHQIFRYAVEGRGSGMLKMRYLRPWEKDKPPAKVFRITLTVQ
jgi:inhibitor of cysteine peptidase